MAIDRQHFYWIVPAVIGVLALAIALPLTLIKSSSPSSSDVTLTPISDTGANPFTPSVSTASLNTASPLGKATTTTAAATTTTAGKVASLVSVPGNQPGLYGGTLNNSACNVSTLIDFLESNPLKGQAWANAEGIPYSQLPSYIRSLTPVLLRSDTWVVNHGYSNGYAYPIQEVLQAGTAVLVDDYGVPRARCYCGNPLTPLYHPTTPTYIGPQWPTFSPVNVVVIQQTTIIQNITLIDTDTGDEFNRPVGTDGTDDTSVQGASSTTTAPTTTTTTTTTSPLPTQPPPPPPPSGGGDTNSAINLVQGAINQCGGDQWLVNTQEQTDGEDSTDESVGTLTAVPGNAPNVYEVSVPLVESDGSAETTLNFIANLGNGQVHAGDQTTAEFANGCPGLA